MNKVTNVTKVSMLNIVLKYERYELKAFSFLTCLQTGNESVLLRLTVVGFNSANMYMRVLYIQRNDFDTNSWHIIH